MRVAAVQLGSGLDKEQNRKRVTDAVHNAADQGAEVVILPEATMCDFGRATTDLSELSEDLDGPFVSELCGLTASSGSTVVAGMFERISGEERVFNTLVCVGPQGLLATYRKLHLYDALGWRESERIKAGDVLSDGVCVIELADMRLGVMTCYDLRFPEMARTLVDRGATVLGVPAAWVAGDHKADQWRDLLHARAIESTAYVVASGQPGPKYTGHSMIVDPSGIELAVLDAKVDGGQGSIAVADVSAEQVTKVRQVLPVLENRRFSVQPKP